MLKLVLVMAPLSVAFLVADAMAAPKQQRAAGQGNAPAASRQSGSSIGSAASQPIYVDRQGVMRWRSSHQEVRLFGANYSPFSAGDFQLAKRVGADMKAMIDADMAHFARMGWDGLRLDSWGDWESSDAQGNLIANEHVAVMDYVIAKAKERGITMLLSPIVTYSSAFADKMRDSTYKPGGFSSVYPRDVLGTDPKAIAAQVNYLGQVLDHVNPLTGLALKNEPAIPFVEMINEPVHHPENLAQSVEYIDTLVGAVRGTGSRQITFHNYSQDFRIADALARSRVDGFDFGWYPSGLNTGSTLRGNFLQPIDTFPAVLEPKLARKPRIVYEFDQADLLTGYMYPAFARTFRSVGTQFAAIFSYDMLDTAPYNLSWQTHYINLVHTPRKAVSAIIAGEAMRRLPRMKAYGAYPDNTRFGDFRVSYDTDSSEMNASDAFMYAGDTTAVPRAPAALRRLVGFGSSGVVDYQGTGAYFLDRVRDGVWRLEVYPDQLFVSEPFAQPQPDKIVSRLYSRDWPMRVALPGLGQSFTATPLNVPSDTAARARIAEAGSFHVRPGVWLLTRSGAVDPATLPQTVNRVGLREFHINAPVEYPDHVRTLSGGEIVASRPVNIRVQVASPAEPAQVSLFYRQVGKSGFEAPVAMKRLRGYDYEATLPLDLPAGPYEYIVSMQRGGSARTFPDDAADQPGTWPFEAKQTWRFNVSQPSTPLVLFDAGRDAGAIKIGRPTENARSPIFRMVPGETSNAPAMAFGVPQLGPDTPNHYAGALYIGDRIAARAQAPLQPTSLSVRLRASSGARKTLDLLLIEKDGSGWRGSAIATDRWATVTLPLASLTFSKSVLAPTPFPGLWSYWREGPKARAGSSIRSQDVERLEMRVYRNEGEHAADQGDGVEIASVQLNYGTD